MTRRITRPNWKRTDHGKNGLAIFSRVEQDGCDLLSILAKRRRTLVAAIKAADKAGRTFEELWNGPEHQELRAIWNLEERLRCERTTYVMFEAASVHVNLPRPVDLAALGYTSLAITERYMAAAA
jgi:hypothetical protein